MTGRKNGGGMDWEDFQLWKNFTRDIDPLEEPDWIALEKAVLGTPSRSATPKPEKAGFPSQKLAPPKEALQSSKPQSPQLDGRTQERLRKGKMPIEGILDLHGYTQDRAQARLNRFVTAAHAEGKRCLLIITGKGGDKAALTDGTREEGILKRRLPDWLSQPPLDGLILKTMTAQPRHGGGGAWYVYLRRRKEPLT